MKRDLLTNSEQLAFPRLSWAIQLVLNKEQFPRVTANMLKALAFRESGARQYFDCTGCRSVEAAAKASAALLNMPWQECVRIATPNRDNPNGAVCKFETDPDAVGAATVLAGADRDAQKQRFILASRFGMWMCPMLEWLEPQSVVIAGPVFETFIETPHVQAREACERLHRCLDSMQEINTLLAFTRFRFGENCQRFNTYGASVEAIYRRLVRATGEQ